MILVKHLFIYPIKSMQGISVSQAEVLTSGFKNDRILMLSEPDGTFITAREHPKLLTLKTAIINQKIHISLPAFFTNNNKQQQSILVDFTDFANSPEPTEVWGNYFTSYIASIRINRFFSEFLQRDVQLRWLGSTLSRRIKRYPDMPLSFADGYPYLLLNQASFAYLQQQCPELLDIRQFRGNIIIDTLLPFAEDGWKTIKIGEVVFDVVKPCSRCVMTTFNIKSAHSLEDNEPLKTLRHFRMDAQGNIDFGINMIARTSGTITTQDRMEILEHQTAKSYVKNAASDGKIATKQCSIIFAGKTIQGNNQQTILEQLEQHNIQLPYSCRAGICGRCEVQLVNGNVVAMTQSATNNNDNKILACSCIPTTDITIKLIKK